MIRVLYSGYPEDAISDPQLFTAKVIVALGDKDETKAEIDGVEYYVYREYDDGKDVVIVASRPLKTCDSIEEAKAWIDEQEKLRKMIDDKEVSE